MNIIFLSLSMIALCILCIWLNLKMLDMERRIERLTWELEACKEGLK